MGTYLYVFPPTKIGMVIIIPCFPMSSYFLITALAYLYRVWACVRNNTIYMRQPAIIIWNKTVYDYKILFSDAIVIIIS